MTKADTTVDPTRAGVYERDHVLPRPLTMVQATTPKIVLVASCPHCRWRAEMNAPAVEATAFLLNLLVLHGVEAHLSTPVGPADALACIRRPV